MTLYAYCLSDELTAGMLEDAAGVGGQGPRLLEHEGISVAVSDFEGERVSVERQNVFAHERVVQRVLRYVTPLPFRFGTLVTAHRLEEYLAGNRAQLLQGLERVRGSVEMSVKIIWDTEAVRREGFKAESRSGEKGGRALGKGAAYLAARRKAILGDEALKERAEELSAWLIERIGEAASETDVRVRPREALVVRAAFLVGRERLQEYQTRMEEARREREGLRFLTSGPWPPYSFSYINP
jgi:hypothetical protein